MGEKLIKDRELISRNIINIINVKRCQEYDILSGDNMIDVIHNLMNEVDPHVDGYLNEVEVFIEKNKHIINKIVNNEGITLEEKNSFIEALLTIKRKYL